MKKKNCLIVMLMILLLLFSACGKKAEVKGDEIFSCNPDNLLGLDPEKINGVSFAIGDRYRVDFEAGTINGDCYGGDCTVYYEQTYNTEFSSWGAAKSETVGEPETCEP